MATVAASALGSISSFWARPCDGVGLDLGHLLDAVLVAQAVHGLLVEDLRGPALRLAHDGLAELDVGEVAVVLALVDEPLAVEVDHDAEGIGVLLEVVEHPAVAERRRGDVPGDRVAARPVAERDGADVERHADAVAGVVAGAAHAGEVPALAEIAHAHLGVGLEAAAGEHHRLGGDVLVAGLAADGDAGDAAVAVLQQLGRAGAVADLDADLAAALEQELDEAGAAADGLDGDAAVEVVLALDLEGLAAVHGDEAHAVAGAARRWWGASCR